MNKPDMRSFHYAGKHYPFSLVVAERKSLALTVRPDGSLEVRAPQGASSEQIDMFLAKKWLWLEKQLAQFDRYRKPRSEQQYVTGASLYYLGRQYILNVIEDTRSLVRIEGRKLAIHTASFLSDEHHNQKLISRWLDNRRKLVFFQQYNTACARFHLDEKTRPQLKWKKMRTQWGSYSSKTHTVYLNSRLIEAPTEAIRFVCIHELCHIQYPHHDVEFYKAMDRYQDTGWRKVEERLELRFG